jgi:hypothetical protein
MALQCTIIQKKEWYPDVVLGGPAEKRHDSCAIVEVVYTILFSDKPKVQKIP